jgi:hypothetical protein
MARTFDNLIGGTRARLARLRAKADTMNTARIKHYKTGADCGYRYSKAPRYTWRDVRYSKCGYTDAHGPHFNASGDYCTLPASVLDGLRDVGSTPDILGRRYGGWYADAFQDETYTGHVWQLPARNGAARYIAGYITQGEYAVLDCTRGRLVHYCQKESAARAADGLAECMAERDREYSERDQAVQIADVNRQDALADARRLIAQLKEQKAAGPLAGSLCQRLTLELENARDEWHAALNKWIEARDELTRYESRAGA